MELLRKSLKAYGFCLLLFILLTFLLAALIRFTGFPQDWSFGGLIAAMAAACLILGILEGKTVGKKGIFIGLLAAALFMLIILLAGGSVFSSSFTPDSLQIFHLIPLAAGMIGGIVGANY